MKLIDFSREGHHKIYQESLLKIKYLELLIFEESFSFKKDKFKILKKMLKAIYLEKDEDIHYLTLDFLYKYPLLKRINKNRIVVGTLHKEPNSFFKKILLKNFSKKITKIIVHSEFIKNKLNEIGIYNVQVIEYPSFYDYSKLKKENLRKQEKVEGKIVISCLGGTRFDKGLDILLKAFEYIDEDIKNKILLNIIGKEEYFKKDYVDQMVQKNKINIKFKYDFVTDEEFMKNVLITDIMVMPYRKIFGGNSGPMTEAVVNKIPSLVPSGTNIGNLVEKYNLGDTFESENPKDLAKVLSRMIKEKKEYFTTIYNEKLTLEKFIKSHEEIYK